ncbi:MAG: (2Fe-2S) ferredoxin domain-containing protein [Oscillatoriales cyanobacterium RM1_1_9]|nr:(2Fe-2S) ferredoxin domain-containing protein [Oscillatoriales cyanobacterium SM2_3_0]NJO44266.1 (2Fe-2S) ferredoxin domain-containing protein [Oscillatoriales cyanobacterium RM2_1_1]NJO70877.1 (2Fe-2S) ferredoxin domain-containing protein [Oscillatoriales cyanobacterium RM1_1_9]
MTSDSEHQILICQNRTCRQQGSAQVLANGLANFKALSISDWTIRGTGCLGHCGSGPMILILPEEICCDRVQPEDISSLIQLVLLAKNKL